MTAKKKGRPDDRSNRRTSEESELVSLSRGLSNGKSRETDTILNHTTLSVWAATLILCSVLVFGLYQVRGSLDGIQAALEQSEQDKKLLLEGMDELLVRGERPNQLLASAEPQSQEAVNTPPPPEPPEKDEIEKSESNDLARKYKIYYRTKDGDDLPGISERFNVSEDQLRLWNALKATDSLIPGQVLVINKSAKPSKPVAVARAPSPSDAERVEKKEEPVVEEPAPPSEVKPDDAAAEETPVEKPDAAEGTDDSLAAGAEEPMPEPPEKVSDEPVDETVHIVQEGESLSIIGQKYGVHWLTLAAWNDIDSPETVYVGQRLRIPEVSERTETSLPTSEVRHKVLGGENLYRIGRLYGLSWEEIAQANGIANPSQVYEGQVLKIPVAEGAPEE